ncbi:MAG: hypothetical protein ABIK09_04110 [Pseudomonadota bacterium]
MTDTNTDALPLRIHGAVVWTLIVVVVVAAALGTVAVMDGGLPDWYMHLGMWGALVIYVLLYLNSFYGRRAVRQWFNLVVFVAVSLFWMYVLKGLVPAQTMAVAGEIVERPALPLLWGPIALLVVEDLLLVAHAAVVGRWRWSPLPVTVSGPEPAPEDPADD